MNQEELTRRSWGPHSTPLLNCWPVWPPSSPVRSVSVMVTGRRRCRLVHRTCRFWAVSRFWAKTSGNLCARWPRSEWICALSPVLSLNPGFYTVPTCFVHTQGVKPTQARRENEIGVSSRWPSSPSLPERFDRISDSYQCIHVLVSDPVG